MGVNTSKVNSFVNTVKTLLGYKVDKDNGVAQITSVNSNNLTNIGDLESGATQKDINEAIDTAIGTKQDSASAFSGSYTDLTDKPAYTPTVTSGTAGAYKLGSININGSNVDIYGIDTDTNTIYGADGTTIELNSGIFSVKSGVFASSAHTQASSTITDTNRYYFIDNESQNQQSINEALDEKIGDAVDYINGDVDTTNINIYENTRNKTTTISISSTDSQYPSAKAVYDYVDSIFGDLEEDMLG